MAATVSIRVNTGTNAGTQSAAVTGIDFISADNATNSLANRTTYPVVADDRSFEKWLTARIDAAPDNQCDNWQFWTDGAVQSNTTLYAGVTATGATPTDSNSTVATTDATTYTSGSKLSWDTSALTSIGHVTEFLVLQLDAGASATAGNWGQEVLNYSYDET